MPKVTFLAGDIPPKTGGEFYNHKVYTYLKQSGLAVEYINLHKLRYLFKLTWIPLLGNIAIALCLAVLAFGRGDRLLVFDQYFAGYLVGMNAIHRCWHRGQSLAIVHHFDRYDSSAPASLGKTCRALAERLKLIWASQMITNSQYSQREIESLGFPAQNITILPPGLEQKVVNSDNPSQPLQLENPAILCVAHCIPRKGILELVEAFATIDRQNYVLHIAGKTDKDARYYRKLRSRVESAGLANAVIFHGRTDDNTLHQLYQQSDLFVLPSYKEGFGIVLLEAMHYGLPIVATNVTALPELVRDGETGLLVPPQNSQALAEALQKLIDRPDLRARLGRAGRQQLLPNYDWDRTGAKFLSIVQTLTPQLNVRASL
ncbi:glycosyltransferase family 4 protein [Synechococcus sp. PCC 7336]|uniref:glycosyltransferase family 4 protein n=1 Tax=Synechococcus sp. PCC 7336 TaxID=195250 RepID=UPI00034BDA10|nr:glycosyltransferase family 4 protein [Synechococcus sp. PCC 7336]